MKIASIIAEYNPFHSGHAYQIQKIKNEYSDFIVVIMSGNFVQRGEPAIINKFGRAKIAVDNGASLVLELPLYYATSNAEIFARGGITILNSMEIIDRLYFGSEDDASTLKNLSEKIYKNLDDGKIKKFLAEGNSYIKSRELAMDFLSQKEKEILKKPNNILGLEYIKNLEKLNSKIEAHSMPRKNVNHKDDFVLEGFASASHIRSLAYRGENVSSFLPGYDLVVENKLENYFEIFKYKMLAGKINFTDYFDYEVGLENRIIENLDAKNFEELIEKVHSKRHSKSRIKRLVLEILLDIKKDSIKKSLETPYTRVLACDERGIEILKKSKNKNKIYSFKSFYDKSTGITKEMLDKEILANDLYNIKSGKIKTDFTREVYKKL
ncbi:MAG: nucleotidyltransferase family protein [Peptoniphilus grossensis]|uniref:tRNA(Met) cytidine acetate ligase n=1 Tax=Peptoniphilus grossensis TaxID=1465756 RepID=UPI00258840BE|nr:nucleotidyltransferase family protein [Peptoniphilus grossensis]MDU5099970.1 nucleotidyltransferase family protein [Peptoniphilus grossensis]